jgi:hypothetical protein
VLVGRGVRIVFGEDREVYAQRLEPKEHVPIQLGVRELPIFLRRPLLGPAFLRRASRRSLCWGEIPRARVPRGLPVRADDPSRMASVGQSSPRFMESTAWAAARAVRAM